MLGFILNFFSIGFVGSFTPIRIGYHDHEMTSITQRNLIPLSNLVDMNLMTNNTVMHPASFDNNSILQTDCMSSSSSYKLCVAQEDDLPLVAQLTMDAFGSDTLTLNSEFSSIEKSMIQPGISLLNMYSNAVTYTEILSGLRSRSLTLMNRGDSYTVENVIGLPSDIEASRSSIILVLAETNEENDNNSGMSAKNIVATVEMRLQPPDAKIPFSLPFLDVIERRLGQWNKNDDQVKGVDNLEPYLSNLCVASELRGMGIGKALVQSLEYLVKTVWGYKRVYLHVDLDNEAALRLYQNADYNDVGFRWNPFWAGDASKIGYFVKKLR